MWSTEKKTKEETLLSRYFRDCKGCNFCEGEMSHTTTITSEALQLTIIYSLLIDLLIIFHN